MADIPTPTPLLGGLGRINPIRGARVDYYTIDEAVSIPWTVPVWAVDGTFNLNATWDNWAKLWKNLGVAHLAAINLLEVHFDKEKNELSNASQVLSAAGLG